MFLSNQSFSNRAEAGKLLAEKLAPWASYNPCVLAIPPGGVPIAFEIAKELHCDLDILPVQTIASLTNPELSIGAIAEDGSVIWDNSLIKALKIAKKNLNPRAQLKLAELAEKIRIWRGKSSPISLANRLVIIVDEGLVSGTTMKLAIQFARKKGANQVVVAVPVGPASSTAALKKEADEMNVFFEPQEFYSVRQWYDEFKSVEDDEVAQILEEMSQPLHELQEMEADECRVDIFDEETRIIGTLLLPENARGVVIFSQTTGNIHKDPRNLRIAHTLKKDGLGSLLIDLLTGHEAEDKNNHLDLALLTSRLLIATQWIRRHVTTSSLPIAYFGTGVGASAALTASAIDVGISAVVCQAGQLDLAKEVIDSVSTRTLFIVGDRDTQNLIVNQQAHNRVQGSQLVVILGGSAHLEELSSFEKVIEYAEDWISDSITVRPQEKSP